MLLSAELPREGEDAGAPRRQKARDRPAEATTAPRLARPAQDTAAEPGPDTMTADQRAPKSPADASGRPAPAHKDSANGNMRNLRSPWRLRARAGGGGLEAAETTRAVA